jgi:hypothetical protein
MVRKSLFIFFLSFLAFKISYSQQVDTTYQVSEDSLNGKNQKNGSYEKTFPKKKPSISGLRFSLGGGIATPLGSGDISALITANVNFRIYESGFLTIGYDLFELFVFKNKYANVIYIAPNLNANFFEDNFSFFGGIGFYFVLPKKDGIQPPGIQFFGRIEYNLSRKYSIGTEIKHIKFIGEKLNYPLYQFNLYFSIKL